MNTAKVLIVHHTGGTDANPLADTSHHTAEMIRQWHLAKGWDDIGYNWVIEKTGKIVKGRDEKKSGAHTIGWNTMSIGVCLSGNFDATLPTPEQISSFKKLYLELRQRYPILTPETVFPHRKFAQKTCYGKKLTDYWAANLAREALNAPNPKEEIKKQIIAL